MIVHVASMTTQYDDASHRPHRCFCSTFVIELTRRDSLFLTFSWKRGATRYRKFLIDIEFNNTVSEGSRIERTHALMPDPRLNGEDGVDALHLVPVETTPIYTH